MSRLFAVADAVVEELNATTWSQAFTATRVLVSSVDWKALDTIRVAVRGVSIRPQQVSRAKSINRVVVEVCVQQRLPAVDSDTVDPFVTLLEEIAAHFDGVRLAQIPDAFVESAVAEPPYDETHLAERKQFTGVVALEVADWT